MLMKVKQAEHHVYEKYTAPSTSRLWNCRDQQTEERLSAAFWIVPVFMVS